MNPSGKYFFQLILLSLLLTVCEAGLFQNPIVHASVANDIGAGVDLSIHCKSADDDLGQHILPYSGNFTFHFRPNFFGTTLFFCSFAWPNTIHRFDVYKSERDKDLCKHQCNWSIRLNGPCLVDQADHGKEICYNWPSPVLISREI
ncbi:hypothetical protein ACOSQ4_027404 [Xanthoceras sorbifolium]